MNTIGLKYFDSKTVDRPPFILVAGILGNRVKAYRLLSSEYPLKQRVLRGKIFCSRCSTYHTTEHEYYDLASIVTPQEKQDGEKCVLGNMDIMDFEKSLSQTKASVMKGFTSLDIACLGEVDTGTLLNLMPDFDSMVRDFDSLYEGILNGKAITGEQYRSRNHECVQKYRKLLNSFSDNNLRAAVQLIVGEASDGIGKKIDELTGAKLVPVIEASKTPALPAPHESWIKKFGGFRKKSQN